MIKLNDSNIFIGQIKQLLKNFNLPNCPIGEENKEPNKHFIQDDKIYLYEKNSSKNIPVSNYIYNSYYPNLTSNLKLENNIYDRYTHRYLGRYLRFLRDYRNVDLMSMYNCFDGELFSKSFNFKILESNKDFISNKNDTVYSIPISLNKDYIINLSFNYIIEGCLYIDNDDLLNKDENESLKSIASKSYFKRAFYKNSAILNLFDNIKDQELSNILQNYNQDLKLLLKIPAALKSSITIIEKKHNEMLSPLNNLQLFNYTNNNNYLLADKLIEYLTENVIYPLSQDYDIEKVQRCLNNLPYIQGNSSEQSYYGKWSNYDTGRIIYFIWINKLQDKYFDLLGYCDKDIEKELNIAISQLEQKKGISIGGII